MASGSAGVHQAAEEDGMTLAANESFPIRDRRERFVHRVCLEKARSSCRSDDSLSGGSERD